MPDWALILAAYLLGAFLMLAACWPTCRPRDSGPVPWYWLWCWGLDAIGGALVGLILLWALANVPVGR